MEKCMMIGCDLHDKSMLLKGAVNRGKPWLKTYGTAIGSRRRLVADLHRRAAKAGVWRIVFAYEACGFGFLLHDELVAAGIECYLVAPSKMPRSAHSRKRKTDERDAQALLDALRSFVLAGVALPVVWVPPLDVRRLRMPAPPRHGSVGFSSSTVLRMLRPSRGRRRTGVGWIRSVPGR